MGFVSFMEWIFEVTSIGFVRLRPLARAPESMSEGASGYDLRARLEAPIHVEPGARCLVPTGIALEIPFGFEGQIRPRSGLAMKHGLTVLNSPGTIDSDYRGEVTVILINLGSEPVTIGDGDRIAQLVVSAAEKVTFVHFERLSETDRGDGGFGHTGR